MNRRELILLGMFLLVYASFNYYFSLELLNSGLVAAPFTRWVTVFFAVMTVSPLIVSGSWGSLPVTVRYVLGTIAFYWTATMMQFTAWSLIFKLVRRTGRPLLAFLGGGGAFPEGGRADFLIPMMITVLATIYGFWEATQIQIAWYEIRSDKIPPEISRVRIVQISDLHLGMLENRQRLERVLKRVEAATPDIVVSTGDLVDVHLQDRNWLLQRLKRLSPRWGKFAVTGNHEVYAGLDTAVTFLTDAGFQVLRGTAVQVTPFLGISGVDDDDAVGMQLIAEPDELEILSRLPERQFRLFLKHTPKVAAHTLGHFDLQLSGHTHGGQIFPLFLVQFAVYGFRTGLSELGQGSRLLLSRGAGTWGPPVRVFAPPEICVVDLVPRGTQSHEPFSNQDG